MSEGNYKLIRDIPIITHINLHNEYLKRKVVFINTNTILLAKLLFHELNNNWTIYKNWQVIF